MNNTLHVFVTVLTQAERHGWPHPEIFDFGTRAGQDAATTAEEFGFSEVIVEFGRVHELKPPAVARTRMVEKFLKSDAEYLLMMDNDTPPSYLGTPLNPFSMLRGLRGGRGHFDIVAAPVTTYQQGHMPVTLYKAQPDIGPHALRSLSHDEVMSSEATDRLLPLDAAGTGMMMVHRCVLADLYPWCFLPDPEADWDMEFWRRRFTTGFPEDIFFTRKALRAGFRLAGDFRMVCSHWHSIDYLHVAITRKIEKPEDLGLGPGVVGAVDEAGQKG